MKSTITMNTPYMEPSGFDDPVGHTSNMKQGFGVIDPDRQ